MTDIFNGFFNGKKILVTGHTGFKGSWLTQWLLSAGADLCGISLESEYDNSLFDVLKLEDEIEHHICDINNLSLLEKIVENFKPEIVFHLAAQPLVRLSYEIPVQTFQTNVVGTANVLDCIRRCDSVRSAVCITTDKCYENKEWIYGYRENDQLGGFDPYSASKACSELVISSYRNSFFNLNEFSHSHNTLIASVRAGNVIGGGDWAKDRIIPDCIRAIESDEPLVLRNPAATRPWEHVLEPLFGYLLLSEKLFNGKKAYSGAWNFGPTNEGVVKVKDIAEKIINKWGKGSIELGNEKGPHEANLLMLDISKARNFLNWTPTLTIDETVDLIVEWYKSPKENKKKITLKQIGFFQSKIK